MLQAFILILSGVKIFCPVIQKHMIVLSLMSIVNIPQLHIENQGSEGQFGEISCENGFSRQFRRRYTVLGFDK